MELEDDDDALLLAAVSERQLLLDIVEHELCLVGSTGRSTQVKNLAVGFCIVLACHFLPIAGTAAGVITHDTPEGNLGGFLEATSNSRLKESIEMYTLAPYIRGNFYKSKVVNLFADGIFEYGHIDGVGAKSNVYGFGIRPGVMIKLNERFSFVTRLGGISYASTDTDYEKGSSRITAFEFNLTSLDNLEFGLYYNF